MAARPVVLPEAYSGETNWEDWAYHFENVATVNAWTAEQKLQWLQGPTDGASATSIPALIGNIQRKLRRGDESLARAI